jgi:hypothetical protein
MLPAPGSLKRQKKSGRRSIPRVFKNMRNFLERFLRMFAALKRPSMGDRIVAAVLGIMSLAMAVLLLIGFSFVVLLALILIAKLVIGLAIYRWWMQRRQMGQRSESFRPRGFDDATSDADLARPPARRIITIKMQADENIKKID